MLQSLNRLAETLSCKINVVSLSGVCTGGHNSTLIRFTLIALFKNKNKNNNNNKKYIYIYIRLEYYYSI
jgi:hypothetical protein